MSDEITKLVDLAQHSRGWVFREYPPQRARLRGGCELVVIPAWLWRPRLRPRLVRPGGELVRMKRAS